MAEWKTGMTMIVGTGTGAHVVDVVAVAYQQHDSEFHGGHFVLLVDTRGSGLRTIRVKHDAEEDASGPPA